MSEDSRLVLHTAKHPLLSQSLKRQKRAIVPLDAELDNARRILVISGPNAGGKSVCLKTIGLLQYMFQCGYPITASEASELPVFNRIYINIGDEQSIDNDLSTYSSHLLNMNAMAAGADAKTMVLIDEFGSGTEPVIGAAIAFILNVPLRAIERNLKFVQNDGARRAGGIILTFVAIALVIYGVIRLLVPQISDTIMSLIPKLTDYFLRLETNVLAFLEANPELLAWLSANTDLQSLDWAGLIQQTMTVLKNSLTVIAGGAFSAVGSLTGGIVNGVIGIVFAIYCLARKEILARQSRCLLYAFLPETTSDEIIRVMRLTNSTFSNFISGQCLEACILGCMFAIAMAVFKLPYITLVSVLIAVTALVPIVGAFVGCAVSAFLILVNDPFQAVVFVAMFLVLQQIENNLIYPKVVGTSIGLPGMWVLLAVTVGGEIMGVAGMLVMIPLVSVVYTLLREITYKRVEERQIDSEKLRDHPPELKSRFKENRERREHIKFRREMRALAEKYKAQKKNHK